MKNAPRKRTKERKNKRKGDKRKEINKESKKVFVDDDFCARAKKRIGRRFRRHPIRVNP